MNTLKLLKILGTVLLTTLIVGNIVMVFQLIPMAQNHPSVWGWVEAGGIGIIGMVLALVVMWWPDPPKSEKK